jgi:tetratricopeptide (TPR) repeat protein/CHAT domain-containing protein
MRLRRLRGAWALAAGMGLATTPSGGYAQEAIPLEVLSDAPAYSARGWELRRAEDAQQARAYFQEALRRDPMLVDALVGSAAVDWDVDRYAEMRAHVDAALVIDPESAAALRWRALWRLDALELEEGLADANEAMRLAPHDPEGYSTRGFLLLQLGRTEEAWADFAERIRREPTNPEAWRARLQACSLSGNVEQGLQDAARLLEMSADAPWVRAQALRGRGALRFAMGEIDAAIDDYEQAAAALPSNPVYLTLLASALSRRGEQSDLERSIALCTQAITMDPTLTWALQQRAKGYRLLKQFDAALTDVDEAIRLDPQSALNHNARAFVLEEMQRYEEAAEACGAAIEQRPRDPSYWINRAILYRDNLQNSHQAIVDYTVAITLSPNDATLLAGRGIARQLAKDLDRAIADYTSAVTLDPEYANGFRLRALACYESGQRDNAVGDFERAAELEPDNLQYQTDRANVYLALRDYARFADAASALIELSPDDPRYLGYRAGAYLKLTNWDRAISDLNRAIELEPENVDHFLMRCEAYLRQGNVRRALEDSDRALELAPDNAIVHRARGATYLELKRFAEAIPAYEKAQTIEYLESVDAQIAHCQRELYCYRADEEDDATLLVPAAEAGDRLAALYTKVYPDGDMAALAFDIAGRIRMEMEEFDAAEERFRAALAWRQERQPADHPDVYDAQAALVRLARFRSLTSEQRDQYWVARAEFEKLRDAALVGRWTDPDSVDIARRHVDVYGEVLGPGDVLYLEALVSVATVYLATGEYELAEPALVKAVELAEQEVPAMHPFFHRLYNRFATLYAGMDLNERAKDYAEREAELTKAASGEYSEDYARALANVAVLAKRLGETDQARALHSRATEITRRVSGEEHPEYATQLVRQADDFGLRKEPEKCRQLLLQAMSILDTPDNRQREVFAHCLNRLAVLSLDARNQGEAFDYVRRAREVTAAAKGVKHVEYAQCLSSEAWLMELDGDYEASLELRRQAYEIVARSLDETGMLLTESQQLHARRQMLAYLDNYLTTIDQVGGHDAEAYLAALRWKGSTLARQRAARVAAEDPKLETLFGELREATRQWATLVQAGPTADRETWQPRRDALEVEKARLEGELSRQSSAFREAFEEVTIERVAESLPEDAVLVDYLESEYIRPDPEDAANVLSRKVLIAFVVHPDGRVDRFDLGGANALSAAIDVWRSSYGQSPASRDAGQYLRSRVWEPLARAIQGKNLVLVSPDGALGRLPFVALPGDDPDRFLLEDVRIAVAPVPQLIPVLVSAVDSDPKFELLVMGGVLYSRAAATADADEPSAVDEPTAAPSDEETSERDPRGTPRAIEGATHWDFLDGTAREAAAIKDLFVAVRKVQPDSGDIVELREDNATEEQFRTLAPQARILHLATHGFFADADQSALAHVGPATVTEQVDDATRSAPPGFRPGLLSGLVLYGANDPPELNGEQFEAAKLPDDGYLTAEEISFLSLGSTRLAVLSACETGLGRAQGGEGLLGIQRAFQTAGVRTTVATLWKVDDAWTERLMTAFYRNALEGQQSYLDALRNAQLEILQQLREGGMVLPEEFRGADAPVESADAVRGAPYFWAAFTLSGDWR